MKKLIFALTLITITATAQDYQVGAVSSVGQSFRMEGLISVTDSVFIIKMNTAPQPNYYKITQRANQNIYITDGTASDKITIIPASGKIRGFEYDHTIVHDQDARFNGKQILFHVRKK